MWLAIDNNGIGCVLYEAVVPMNQFGSASQEDVIPCRQFGASYAAERVLEGAAT